MKVPDVHVKVVLDYVLSARPLWLVLIQLLGVLSVLVGISFWSIPAALIVGGLFAVGAVEMQAPRRNAKDDEATRVKIHEALKKGVNPFADGVPPEDRWIQYVRLVTTPKAS